MLAILKWLPFLGKAASIGKWFAPLAAIIPGGQIGLILSSILNGIITFIRWLIEDVVDVLTKPRLALLFVIGLAGGGWFAADFYRDRMQDLRVEVANTRKQLNISQAEIRLWNERHAEEQSRAEAAQKASAEAEAKVKADQAATDARARAKRVRDASGAAAPAKGPAAATGAGLSWPWKL